MTPEFDDLTPWAQRTCERAYQKRPGRESDGSKRASREDFRAGFIAALLFLHSWSSFREPDRWKTPWA